MKEDSILLDVFYCIACLEQTADCVSWMKDEPDEVVLPLCRSCHENMSTDARVQFMTWWLDRHQGWAAKLENLATLMVAESKRRDRPSKN